MTSSAAEGSTKLREKATRQKKNGNLNNTVIIILSKHEGGETDQWLR